MEIPFHKPFITEDEIRAAADCLRSGWLTMGNITAEFEQVFSRLLEGRYAIAVNSCTAALHLSLCCLNLNPGDEVIVPSVTFVSTAETVRYTGAVPVLADVDPETGLITPETFKAAVSSRTRAVIPVHYGGQPCDMDEICETAEKLGIEVIEDAAHALPAYYRGRPVGSSGRLTCFSFYATKTVTTGEGGMILTDRPDFADRIRSLRLHGISRDAWKRYSKEGTWMYDVLENGFKYNPADIASAIGLEQLKKIHMLNDKRRALAERYTQAFTDVPGLIPFAEKEDRRSSWHLYPLRINPEESAVNRDRMAEELRASGILTSVHFIPLYRFTAYRQSGRPENFPGAEKFFSMELSLPLYPSLSSEEQEYVISSVLKICSGKSSGK